ncbi:hypothetical protein [Dapis sp. BLCC M172]|uniref:hypothetical protein n=1 Tax=Dapis sp. BLCC M172 TaxID=2975281 RepID=UPI003CFA100C
MYQNLSISIEASYHIYWGASQWVNKAKNLSLLGNREHLTGNREERIGMEEKSILARYEMHPFIGYSLNILKLNNLEELVYI